MKYYLKFLFLLLNGYVFSQNPGRVREVPVGLGWAGNSINTVVFRKNSLTSFENTQYISYYNNDGFVVLGKRKLNKKKWDLVVTKLKADITDAHKSISIIVDGNGYLHMAWNQHGNPLHYVKSILPGSLEMSDELMMTGQQEKNVTYPEFYKLPGGDLIFLYRDGQSGNGNLVINRYDLKTKRWQQLHSNLIDGEGERNAYWQACVDGQGTIHLSWVWRESADASSNHDICYARSRDGGFTWETAQSSPYQLPINNKTAAYACYIQQKAELINQTSMMVNEDGVPFIASYWKDPKEAVPQYHVVYFSENKWIVQNTGFRKTAFTLSGTGTKQIPISRPQLLTWKKQEQNAVALLFRDEETGSKVSLAINQDISKNEWKVFQLTKESVGSWEPSFDIDIWKQKKELHVFVEKTEQADQEGVTDFPPQRVRVMELSFK